MACVSSITFVYANSSNDEVLYRLQEYGLTKYTKRSDFRPDDFITRWEAAKFVTQYADAAWIEKQLWANCTFTDINNYDSSLRPFISQACQFELLRWFKNKFMPYDYITQAQALAIVIRSINGYQDETTTPRYHNYYILWQQIGLITNETQKLLDTTNITREELAKWLYIAFYQNNTDD